LRHNTARESPETGTKEFKKQNKTSNHREKEEAKNTSNLLHKKDPQLTRDL
jgi:hypothetical protein